VVCYAATQPPSTGKGTGWVDSDDAPRRRHDGDSPSPADPNLLRGLVVPVAIQSWSLTSLQQRFFKTGARLIRHARYFILQLAESYLTLSLFRQILQRIERLGWHPT
jgi:hypothetical protein